MSEGGGQNSNPMTQDVLDSWKKATNSDCSWLTFPTTYKRNNNEERKPSWYRWHCRKPPQATATSRRKPPPQAIASSGRRKQPPQAAIASHRQRKVSRQLRPQQPQKSAASAYSLQAKGSNFSSILGLASTRCYDSTILLSLASLTWFFIDQAAARSWPQSFSMFLSCFFVLFSHICKNEVWSNKKCVWQLI